MKNKQLILSLCTILLVFLLAGCSSAGNSGPSAGTQSAGTSAASSTGSGPAGSSPTGSASPSGSPAAANDTEKTTLKGTVTAIAGKTLTLDVQNDSIQTTPSTASPSGTANSAGNSASGGVTKGVVLTLSDSTVITLLSGNKGKISDIKIGNTVSITGTTTVITDVTVLS